MRRHTVLSLHAIAVLSCGLAAHAAAQTAVLDREAEATYGSTHIQAGVTPNPITVPLAAGGFNDASTVDPDCRGWIASTPDHRLYYNAYWRELYISAAAPEDVALVVNAPDGSWLCDDNGYEDLNPGVHFAQPASGRYDIWLGTIEGGAPSSTLWLSETGFGPDGAPIIDYTRAAAYGELRLEAGFTPSTRSVSLIAGGSALAATALPECVGHVAAGPDVKLYYSAGEPYDLVLSAQSGGDVTLLVNTPQGHWVCQDEDSDSGGPVITFTAPISGRYDIFVGTRGEDTAGAVLEVSERERF